MTLDISCCQQSVHSLEIITDCNNNQINELSPENGDIKADDDSDDDGHSEGDDHSDDDCIEEQINTDSVGDDGNADRDEIHNDHSDYCQVMTIPLETVTMALKEEKYASPVTNNQKQLNNCIEALLRDTDLTQDFVESLLYHFQFAYNIAMPRNIKIENKHVTSFYSRVTLFLQTSAYTKLVEKLFKTEELTSFHHRTAFAVVKLAREEIIARASNPVLWETLEKSRTIAGEVMKGSAGGRGKLRYLGGWVVAKLKYKKKRFVRRNLYKKNLKEAVDKSDKEVRILETLTETEASLLDCSSDQESLEFTKKKQNLRGGLTNISDNFFNFFTSLDDKVQQLMTELAVNIHGKNFHAYLCDSISNNENIYSEFTKLVNLSVSEEMLKNVFNQIVQKYMMIITAQFRREYLRKLNVMKEEAHRREIRMVKRKSSTSSQQMVSEKRPRGEDGLLPLKKQTKRSGPPLRGKAPKTVLWPCGICGSSCSENSVCCDLCDKWHHFTCLNCNEDEFEADWFCPACKSCD